MKSFSGRFSIKARVTIWYTAFMLLLVGAALLALLSTARNISANNLRTELMDAVSDTVSDVRFRHGKLDTERLDFYKNGVSLFIYDTKGYLLAPQQNLGIQVDSMLTDQQVRTVDSASGRQMVYDVYAASDGTAFWVRGISSLNESVQTYGTIRLLIFVTFPVFLLFAVLGGYRITRSAFRPIGQMADTAKKITSGNDLSRRIETSGRRDELSHLGATMNDMLSRLQASFENERQFTSDVSHELRTPLAVIQSQCEYALSEGTSAEEKEEALRSIRKQTGRMSKVVSQLLLLSRADRGVFTIEKKPVDLSGLCELCCMDLMPAAEAAGLSLRYEIAPELTVLGDETLLSRLVTNLLTNAIRYNRENGKILLTLKQDKADEKQPLQGAPEAGPFSKTADTASEKEEKALASAVRLTVSDSGIGLREEELPKIWNRFYRADASRSSEGTGLGLSMVQWIAKEHGGSVSAESTFGEGSRFTVMLPGK